MPSLVLIIDSMTHPARVPGNM